MPTEPVKTTPDGDGLSRRSFLEAAAGALLASGLPPLKGNEEQKPWWLTRLKGPSDVVDIRSNRLLLDGIVDEALVAHVLDRAVMSLTRSPVAVTAWRNVVGDAKKIVVKFNSVGGELTRSTAGLARAILDCLERAGYPVDRVALVEAPMYLSRQISTRKPSSGWGETIPLGGRDEPLANYLLEADAVINVGFLKTHQIAGMSGCMKNLSHAVIRRPALYHANGCSPFVGDVVSAPPVSSRLKLNILNALRVLASDGPDGSAIGLTSYNGLLLSFDPLALDVTGLSVLESERRQLGLSGLMAPLYLQDASRAEIGRWRASDVRRVAIDA